MKFTRRDLVFGAGAVAATGIAPTWPVMQKTDCPQCFIVAFSHG
jgi:hypothetical protein